MSTTQDLAFLARCAEDAARAAGQLLLKRPDRVDTKYNAIDLVTEVDLASEACIREVLGRLTPDIPVQGEEGGGVVTGLRWVVDPLDGTTNFVHDYPAYVVSIGLCQDQRPLAGCVYHPLTRQAFTAWRGGGAWRDGERIQASAVTTPDRALGVTGFPYSRREQIEPLLAYVARALKATHGVRRSGSAAFDLCTVAAGRADYFWEFGLSPWDTAAGAVLVEEAGGRVSRLDGGAWHPGSPDVLASNPWIHDALVRLLQGD